MSSGKWVNPRGGWIVFDRFTVPPELIVFLLLKPSHSTSSPSPIGSMRSSCILFTSSACRFVRALLMARTIAAPPRMVSARGSYSGSSTSVTVRNWSRSPLNTAASGTSLLDFASCKRTTPEHMIRKPITTSMICMAVPWKP